MSMEQAAPKAVVIGGSNGIGLAIAKDFLARGYRVCILDICAPERLTENCSYDFCNLLYPDWALLEKLAADPEVRALMITAGFGRVADFEYLHRAEIGNMLKVNTMVAIQIIRAFYGRIKSSKPFYCGIMGSIAGLVSSPMFSVYAASKAGVCRFVESVNIELEVADCANRILDVSPGSIQGTRFNGGENRPELTENLAHEIVARMLGGETRYIPDYETVYGGVINRYQTDGHAFGLSSYQYKKASGRVFNEEKVRIGYLSGTFDLFHVGHLNLLRRARENCDYLIVGVHPDASHKGKETFIPFAERMEIVGGCKYVDQVVEACREDSDAWEKWRYNRLFVGSDYAGSERFARYEQFFADKNVQIMYFPYTQGTSSTQIRNTILQKTKKDSEI